MDFGKSGNPEEKYEGVFYAPGGEATVYQSAHVFGSLVAGTITIDNKGSIHWDQALLDKDPLAGAGGAGSSTARITYLHISRTNVSLAD